MSITSVGAIFAMGSKLLQRIYIPSADDSEIDGQFVGDGESLLWVPIAVYREGGPTAVQAFVGEPAHNGLCHVIDRVTGDILQTIIADPDIYEHPDGHKVVLVD
jgi:hypothetical protein